MKRLLITGVSGLLGLNAALLLKDRFEIVGTCNRQKLSSAGFTVIQQDFSTDSPEALIDSVQPDVILHCAALANIDACEKSPELAMQINGILPGRFAAAAKSNNVRMIHISTDAVFDGMQSGEDGYHEEDPANPINSYARSKYVGEQEVLTKNPDAVVARVNFYGWSASGSRSLAEIFYKDLVAGKQRMGFTDVFFCPLYVQKLVETLMAVAELPFSGLLHVFSAEFQSKYRFGLSIAEKLGVDTDLVKPVSWREAGLTAVRSPNLIMNTDRLKKLGVGNSMQAENLDLFFQAKQQSITESIHQIIGNQESI